jgi:uncharacterized protein YaaR (DUF327 family)
MTTHEIIKKLVGSIEPLGETSEDERRFENLKNFTNLVHALVLDLDEMAYRHKHSHEFSVKRASDFASKFLSDDLGIAK